MKVELFECKKCEMLEKRAKEALGKQSPMIHAQDILDVLYPPVEGFEMTEFRVWSTPEFLAPVQVKRNAFSWGHCRSETCNHNSHDPYDEGDLIVLNVRELGKYDGFPLYETSEGIRFTYDISKSGFHFAPRYHITKVV